MSVSQKSRSLAIISFLFSLQIATVSYGQKISSYTDYVSLSTKIAEKTLQNQQEDLDSMLEMMAVVKFEILKNQLYSDTRKKTFWINIHNAFVLKEARKKPTVLEDRTKFFSTKSIVIAGVPLSINDIEHGILRRSGFKVNITDEIKQLRVLEIDYRVHFALYFGAKDCPIFIPMKEHELSSQLKELERTYVKEHTSLNFSKKEIVTTELFDWYREDFGNKEGIRRILLKNGLEEASDWKINFQRFNWETRID